jgi:hypothetical protein
MDLIGDTYKALLSSEMHISFYLARQYPSLKIGSCSTPSQHWQKKSRKGGSRLT